MADRRIRQHCANCGLVVMMDHWHWEGHRQLADEINQRGMQVLVHAPVVYENHFADRHMNVAGNRQMADHSLPVLRQLLGQVQHPAQSD